MADRSDTERDRTATSDRGRPAAGQESAFLEDVSARVSELRKDFQEYLAIKIARLKLSFWEMIVAVVSVALGVVCAVACVVTAVVFVFSGLAGWIGEATSKPYLGALLSGVLGLLLVGVSLLVVRRILTKKACPEKSGGHGE
jgi:hypothetical protein